MVVVGGDLDPGLATGAEGDRHSSNQLWTWASAAPFQTVENPTFPPEPAETKFPP